MNGARCPFVPSASNAQVSATLLYVTTIVVPSGEYIASAGGLSVVGPIAVAAPLPSEARIAICEVVVPWMNRSTQDAPPVRREPRVLPDVAVVVARRERVIATRVDVDDADPPRHTIRSPRCIGELRAVRRQGRRVDRVRRDRDRPFARPIAYRRPRTCCCRRTWPSRRTGRGSAARTRRRRRDRLGRSCGDRSARLTTTIVPLPSTVGVITARSSVGDHSNQPTSVPVGNSS